MNSCRHIFPVYHCCGFHSAYKVFLTLDEELFSAALVRGDCVERQSAYQVQTFQKSTHLTIKVHLNT